MRSFAKRPRHTFHRRITLNLERKERKQEAGFDVLNIDYQASIPLTKALWNASAGSYFFSSSILALTSFTF
jgi:hypothetical protein